MTGLTAEELASVAQEVTRQGWSIQRVSSGGGSAWWIGLGGISWNPDFDGNEEERSQALAMVEWLAEHCDGGGWGDAGEAIISKNTTALQRMVLELRTKS